MFAARRVTVVCGALLLASCGGNDGPADTPIRRESPSDEILRIGTTWTSDSPEKKILSPPSPISMFRSQRTSTVTLTATAAHEELELSEDVELRSGAHASCKTTFSHDLQVRYGRKNGEAAVELIRPALRAVRQCDAPHPEPELAEPQRRALLLLRSDRLMVVEPATDQRQYIPLAY